MKTHIVLWTSGWDSTFRLLQIILVEKHIVQPIYIIDESRKSLKNELFAIESILNKIKELYPNEYKSILPIIYFNKKDVVEDKAIKDSFSHILKQIKIGSQYEWLAYYCEQEKLKNVELSIDKDEISFSLFNFINPYLNSDNHIGTNENLNKNAVRTVFNYFKFPLFQTDKKEMLAISKKNNWLKIMQLTWFCHKPKNNNPCGKCNPCKTVIMKGLGFRIPLKNRLKGYFKIIKKNGLNW